MSDKLVFDLSEELDGSPNVFVKKDWLNILDNMNGNYAGNQSVIDTSQLSNSNKYISYREGYLYIPMLLSLQATAGNGTAFQTAATSADYSLGLKNWFGSIIHSFTLDLNGTTIIQQTPFCNMWNSFKLMTSLSQNELITLGPTIGFYPDNPLSWSFATVTAGGQATPNSTSGPGVSNNTNLLIASPVVSGVFNAYKSGQGNDGFLIRQQYINYDTAGIPVASSGASTYNALLPTASVQQLWKSYISNKTATVIQHSISAVVYLRHLHSFFQFVPLLKGVYLKATLSLNNSNTLVSTTGSVNAVSVPNGVTLTSVSVPSGGINPVMVASVGANQGSAFLYSTTNAGTAAVYTVNLSVGATCLNTTITSAGGQVGRNIYLYVPAYTFNPIYEQAYLSSPIKTIKYTDIYQYQVSNITSTSSFNQLITNGIANIKSVLILPFYAVNSNTTGATGVACYQSPFDPAGAGPTSPLAHFSNFNVVISGQNAIYNTQRYAFEEWNNQVYGSNSVNAGQLDGLTSGLISQLGWEMEYCYYYVNVGRMLPVEESVPKSIQIIGQNVCGQALDLIVFTEYGTEISIDVLSGSRV